MTPTEFPAESLMSPAPFPLALEAPATPVTAVSRAMLEQALDMSRQSPRKRIILPLHKSSDATLQRMLNAMQPGTYVRPHRHRHPPKCESVIVLQGALGVVVFSDAGEVRQLLRADAAGPVLGVDSEPDILHTFLALAPDTVLFEVKQGPYEQASDKDFAPWAPAEGTAEAQAYLAQLEALFQK